MNKQKHPFYAHSEADFLIVESEGNVLGRLAILKNKNYCEYHHLSQAFFYYFESVEDQQVTNALFSAAEDWCKKRSITQIMGPRGFLRSNCIGLLVEGFEALPAMGMIYNQPYFGNFLENSGFIKESNHYSGFLDKHLDPRLQQAAQKVLARGNFKVLSFSSTKEMLPWIPKLDEVHHRAFANNPGYYPSTHDEFDLLAKNIIAIADPKYMKLILHNDEVAGFVIAFPDINRAIQISHGRLLPFGWLTMIFEKKFTRIIDMSGIGLLPEYQGLGGNAVLYAEVDRVLYSSRFTKAEIVQVDERNFRSKSDMNTMNVTWNKCHRTYKKVL
jgi:hypothetical protein